MISRRRASPPHNGISLREHFEAILEERDLRYLALFKEKTLRNEQRFIAQQQALHAALLSAEKAVEKVEVANDKRFESVNEFRQTLSDQTKNFVTRIEMAALSDRLTELGARIDRSEGRSGGLSAGWGYLVAAVGVVAAIVAFIIR